MNKVSVIVPVYNVECYMDKCIESLLNQSYANLEIILIDDGSTDNSGRKCDAWGSRDPRIIALHKENGGLSDARNYGIEHSTGQYIVCVDSDDYVDTDYVEYLYSLVCKYNTKMSICQHRVICNGTTKYEFGQIGDEVISSKLCIERMLYHDIIDTSAWAKMYDRSLFNEITYPYGKLFEDIATTYKLMMKCPIISVGYESKYNYIMRKQSIVNGEFSERKLDLLDMTDKMGADVAGAYPDLAKAVLRRRVYARFSTLNQMLYTDKCTDKRKEIIRFIKENGKRVVKDPKTPHRDKVAYYALQMGFNIYKLMWCMVSRKD